MFSIIRERIRQGRRTIAFPKGDAPTVAERFRGLPVLDESKCPEGCQACVEACPTDAIARSEAGRESLSLDLGRCLFCADCVEACPSEGAIRFTNDYRLAVTSREDLTIRSGTAGIRLAAPLETKILRVFGRSLKLRQVSAGGDGSAEADLNVLGTVVFDLSRFGIQFVASPRHADALVVTGPVTQNMKEALLATYEAMPEPKLVIAVGASAISGGIFRDRAEVLNGVDGILPVDLFIPGDPPHPLTILDGILRLLDRLESRR